MTVPGTPAKGERASGAGRRLRSFVAVLVALALGSLGVLWTQTGTIAAFHIPWVLLAAIFYLAEVCLVHLHFRRGAHSFSMSEVPLVLGLFFATPRELLLAQFVGCALALAVQRRQSPLKAAFNLANFAVTTSVAVFLLRAIVPAGSHFDIRAWVGAIVATMVYATLGSVAVGVAIWLSDHGAEAGRLGYAFLMLLGSSLTNLSLGLVAATVIDYQPDAAWLLMVPAATVFLAYRAYIREREKHEILEFLYTATTILTQNPDLEKAIVALLEQAKKT